MKKLHLNKDNLLLLDREGSGGGRPARSEERRVGKKNKR